MTLSVNSWSLSWIMAFHFVVFNNSTQFIKSAGLFWASQSSVQSIENR
jgi:hypothetical protein